MHSTRKQAGPGPDAASGAVITITITATMGESWVSDSELAFMSDDEIIELAHEDLSALLETAAWEITRSW